ncbi:MAG: hypothetical protein NTV00_08600 [Methylococcales bacterium]|nr:hypothetical protein [Methylococcales bacterium]
MNIERYFPILSVVLFILLTSDLMAFNFFRISTLETGGDSEQSLSFQYIYTENDAFRHPASTDSMGVTPCAPLQERLDDAVDGCEETVVAHKVEHQHATQQQHDFI